MEPISRTLGGSIAALRKAKGLTQEQLAARVGVSAPAVSKWETGSSCPDIALLCPLARALDTNVDTLLQFEETLADEEVITRINAILEQALRDGTVDAAQQQLNELLRRYPNCTALQYNAAVAYDSFRLFFPTAPESLQQEWKDSKRSLLERIRSGGNAAYWQSATLSPAALEIADGDPEQGAAQLKELPQQTWDIGGMWALYYMKTDRPEQALELTQKQLYRAVTQAISALVTMTNPKLQPDPDKRHKLCDAYRTLAETFALPDRSDGLLLELYLEQGNIEKAAACFVQYAHALQAPFRLPDPDLFAPGLPARTSEPPLAAVREMLRMLVRAFDQEARYRPLWAVPACRAALDQLKSGLEQAPTA